MKQVLFLCSANYYRSRFAEHLFNHLAPELGLNWRAQSRGLRVGFWGNVGAISDFTVEALKARGIPLDDNHRDPQPLTSTDLAHSQLVVAVKEREHRPLMRRALHPMGRPRGILGRGRRGLRTPDVALPYLEHKVRALMDRLQSAA